jgi:hypothetical protein
MGLIPADLLATVSASLETGNNMGITKEDWLETIDPDLRDRLLEGPLLVVSKTNRYSTVHRRAKMDDITVKRVDQRGTVIGALRLLGLFTRKAYMEPAGDAVHPASSAVAIAEDYPDPTTTSRCQPVRVFPSIYRPQQELADPRALLDLQSAQSSFRPPEPRGGSRLVAPRDLQCRPAANAGHVHRRFNAFFDDHLSLGETSRRDPLVHVGGSSQVSFADPAGSRRTAVPGTPLERARPGTGRARKRVSASALLPESSDRHHLALDIRQFERLAEGQPFGRTPERAGHGQR